MPPSPGISLIAALLAASSLLSAADVVVRMDQPGIPVSPTMYGIFFEDINRAGDGGLYAEMVQDRSFEDFADLLAWTALENPQAKATIARDTSKPLNANNPTCLKLEVTAITGGRAGVFNQGFKGIPATKTGAGDAKWRQKFADAQRAPLNGMAVQAGKSYLFSVDIRAEEKAGPLSVTLENQKGVVLAQQTISGLGSAWQHLEVSLTAKATDDDARLVLSTAKPGTWWIDMVSLFPKDTYKGRRNGWRTDLMQLMTDLHPGLLRFPGGSFSEGHRLIDAWRWKETIGDVAQRPGNWNIWGYRSTNGLGFHEYLQMAEDLGAEPLYVAHVGMAERDFVALDQLEPWIQDVLDAIEYANGPATSTWGAKRAAAGHPQPFHLKYIEIGNENGMGYSWGGGKREDYLPRYLPFSKRIKAAHPEIMTIANIHTEADAPAEIVDEHYYEKPEWFFNAATRYDAYDRTKPKLYLGEYAANKEAGNGNARAALGEAAFLSGLERNADVVLMTSYAPLFTNPPWQRWTPNAIVFDQTRAFGTPSYHVQALFAGNRPDVSLPTTVSGDAAAPLIFACAGRTKSGDVILKVVNRSDLPQSCGIRLAGLQSPLARGSCTELIAAKPTDENSFAEPTKIAPTVHALPAYADQDVHTFPALSVTVLRWSGK